MPDALIFSADARKLVEEANKARGSLKSFEEALASTTQVTKLYTEQGQLLGAVVKTEIDAFKTLTQTLSITKKEVKGVEEEVRTWTNSLQENSKVSKSSITSTAQLDDAIKDLTAKFQTLDPKITSVTVKGATFDNNMKLISGTAIGLGSDLGALTAKFTANTGAIEAESFAYRKLAESAKAAEKAITGGGGAFPKPAAPIPFSQQGRGGSGGSFPKPAAPVVGLDIPASQVGTAVQSLVGTFQKLDPTITAVTLKTSQFDSKNKLLGGTVTATSQTLGKLSADFSATEGEIKAGTVSLTAHAAKTKEAEQITNTFHETMKRLSGTFQRFLEYKAFNAISDGLRQGIVDAKELQVQVSLIRTISQDSQQSQDRFVNQIRNVSGASGFALKDVGKAFYDTTSNQVAKGVNVEGFVKTASDLARATGSQLPDAVNILSSAINAYGLTASDAERLSAQLFKTVDEGRVVLSELANTFGRVAVVASNVGISIEDVEATIAVTTQKGFKSADALTLLTNAMTQLEKPSEKLSAFFKNTLGVASGEGAVQLLGYTGLFKKLVEAVKAGDLSASDVSPDIRGRKQFGVFEQSIDKIEEFKNKLQDTKKVLAEYNRALDIRGESPADKLVKESEKLKNAFTVDLGQSVLKYTAYALDAVGGTDGVTGSVRALTPVIELAGTALIGYGVTATAIALKNSFLGASFGVASRGAGLLAAAFVGFEAGKALLNIGKDQFLIDPQAAEKATQTLETLRKEAIKLKLDKVTNPFDDLTKGLDSAATKAITSLAKIQLATGNSLEGLKAKGIDLSGALKLSFSSLTTSVSESLNKITSDITKSTTAIENSKKAILKLQESSDDAAFNLKLKYAQGSESGNTGGNDQKLRYMEGRLQDLIKKSDTLYSQGTEESVQEARRISEEIKTTLISIADERAALQRLGFESNLKSGLFPQNPNGPNVFTPDFSKFDAERQAEVERQTRREKEFQRYKQEDINVGTSNKEATQRRLAAIKQAAQEFERLSPFSDSGGINQDFTNKNKTFDKNKFLSALDKSQEKILGLTQGPEERKRVEGELLAFRLNAVQQANALELQENLKTKQEQLAGDKDRHNAKIQQLKAEAEAAAKEQVTAKADLENSAKNLTSLLGIVSDIGRSPATRLGEIPIRQGENEKGVPIEQSQTFEGKKVRIAKSIEEFKALTAAATDDKNKINIGGNLALDPKRLTEIEEKYANITRSIRQLNDASGRPDAILAPGPNDTKFSPEQSLQAFQRDIDNLKRSSATLQDNSSRKAVEQGSIDYNLNRPVEELKAKFTEFSGVSIDTLGKIETSVTTASEAFNGFLAKVTAALNGFQAPAQAVPALNIGGQVPVDSNVTYAATGGIVGLFPGQPRGVDQYPIWAAKDERILDAHTSRMYRPVLDAIAAHTAPRYMAAGGIVGDQSIGDVTNNITVNGGATNSETGRVIASHLERLIRRKQVRIKPN